MSKFATVSKSYQDKDSGASRNAALAANHVTEEEVRFLVPFVVGLLAAILRDSKGIYNGLGQKVLGWLRSGAFSSFLGTLTLEEKASMQGRSRASLPNVAFAFLLGRRLDSGTMSLKEDGLRTILLARIASLAGDTSEMTDRGFQSHSTGRKTSADTEKEAPSLETLLALVEKAKADKEASSTIPAVKDDGSQIPKVLTREEEEDAAWAQYLATK